MGATIQLYAVGTTGYGSNATALLTSTVKTDQNGYWTITGKYTCPSAATQVYIVGSGGNPGLASGTNNAAIKLVAALGACGNLTSSTGIDINEVTTVAAAFAMGQYFGTTFGIGQNVANTNGDSFGAPATAQATVGLSNAMATTARLANTADGTAVTTQTLTGTPATYSVTATPETTKVYTIANILASCVNSDGGSTSQCPTLFGAVAPNGGTTPTNTLQAAVYMSVNPTSNSAPLGATSNSQTNLATLFALQTPTSPFVGQTTQPNDWTLGVTYSVPQTATGETTETLINAPDGIAIDSNGNIWIINLNSSATSTESMAGFSPTGVPIANPFNSGATSPASMAAASPRNIAIDTNNNVIATSSSGSAYAFEYSQSTATTSTFLVGGQGYGLTIDGSNNIFISHNSATSNTFSFDEYLGGNLATTSQIKFLFDSPGNTTNQFATISTGGLLYLSKGSTSSAQVEQASNFNTSTCTAGTACTTATATFNFITSGTISNPYNIAAEKNGGVWVADNALNSVTYITGTTGTSFGNTNSFTTPRYVAVDGANNAWFTDRGTGGNSVSEITTAGIVLSPVLSTNGSGATVGYAGFNHANLSTTNGIAIDPSGNIWVPSGNVTVAAAAQNSIFEIIGAAVPTVTPIALALKNSAVGSRP